VIGAEIAELERGAAEREEGQPIGDVPLLVLHEEVDDEERRGEQRQRGCGERVTCLEQRRSPHP